MELFLWGSILAVVIVLLLIQVVRLSGRVRMLRKVIDELEGFDAIQRGIFDYHEESETGDSEGHG